MFLHPRSWAFLYRPRLLRPQRSLHRTCRTQHQQTQHQRRILRLLQHNSQTDTRPYQRVTVSIPTRQPADIFGMALNKIRLGTGENGQPVYHYWQDDPSVPVVVTGPITGIATVTHPDGTAFRYDVSPEVIEVFPGHEVLVAEAIGQRQQNEGHPRHNDDSPFVHTPVDDLDSRPKGSDDGQG